MNRAAGINRPLRASCIIAAITVSSVLLMQPVAFGHGIAGKRFFPTSFAVDDPFVSDEFSLLYNFIQMPGDSGGPPVDTSSLSMEFSKRITPAFGLTAGDQYQWLRTQGDGSVHGFGNLEVGAKYQFYTSEQHETIFSFGVSDEIGNTGNAKVSDPFSVISPAFFFGKGFGDLSDFMNLLRPLAVTGVIGLNFPTRTQTVALNNQTGEVEIARNPTTLTWAFSVQYSLMYLQSSVKDLGLGTPFDRMFVIIEFPMETCLNRDCDGQTTGTVNPGIAWTGKRLELGIAAQIPVNERSGKHPGVLGLVHFFIDDLFPKSIGRPVFP